MLKELRNKKNVKRFFIILIILVVPAFFFWGVQTARTTSKFVVKVFGKRIGIPLFLQFMEETKLSIMFRTGNQYYPHTRDILKKETLRRILLVLDAQRKKLKVNDEEVLRYLEKVPYFQNKGKFDKELYFRIIKGFFHTQPHTFEKMIRNQILIEKLFKKVTENIKTNDKEVLEAYKLKNEKLKVKYIKINPDRFKNKVKVDVSILRKYYNIHREDYRLPPQVKIKFVRIPSNTDPKLLKRAVRIKNLERLAKFLNLPVLESDYFSLNEPIKFIGWEKEINQIAFDLEKDKISPPIFTSTGIYIIKVISKRDSFIPKFEDVEKKVQEDYLREEAQKIALQFAQNIYHSIKSQDLSIVKKENLKIEETDFFSKVDYLSQIGDAQSFFDVLFSHKKGEWVPPLNIRDMVFIFKIEDKKLFDEDKFNQEKEKFAQTFLKIKKELYFANYINKLVQESDLKVSSDFFSS